jgi:hypothetical protein
MIKKGLLAEKNLKRTDDFVIPADFRLSPG